MKTTVGADLQSAILSKGKHADRERRLQIRF